MRDSLRVIRIALFGVILVGAVVPVLAHHSFTTEFDVKQPVTIKGDFTNVERVNPPKPWTMNPRTLKLDTKPENEILEHSPLC
jgi:hypothetical protein